MGLAFFAEINWYLGRAATTIDTRRSHCETSASDSGKEEKTKLTLVLAVMLVISSLVGTSIAGASEADKSKLIALENAWNQAQLHHDARALDELIPATFIYTDYDGTVMNKAQFLADLKDPNYRATMIANEGVRVFSYPNAAIVIGTYHTKGIYKGKGFEHWGRFTDTWIFHNSKWQCVASHTNHIKK